MTGPPTPPPTSAIEIQDAQREASVPPVAATTAPPEVPPAEGASEAQADEPIVVEQPSQPAPPPGPPPAQDYGAAAPTSSYPSGPGGYAADGRRSQHQTQSQAQDPWAGLNSWK